MYNYYFTVTNMHTQIIISLSHDALDTYLIFIPKGLYAKQTSYNYVGTKKCQVDQKQQQLSWT